MGQPSDATARSIDFQFEEVPLVIGFDKETKKPQRIALISGTCSVSCTGTAASGFTWDIDSVTLSGPILHDPDVVIRYVRECQTGHELWAWVTTSISASVGDEIVDKLHEDFPDTRAAT